MLSKRFAVLKSSCDLKKGAPPMGLGLFWAQQGLNFGVKNQ